MGLNFLGLGFSFGAKDAGLDAALSGVNNQFKQLDDSVKSFQATAAEGLSPAEGIADSLQSQLEDLQAGATEGIDLSDAIDLGGAESDAEKAASGLADALDLGGAGEKAEEEVGGLGNAVAGMASEAALGGTGFGRMANSVLGGAGKITGAMGWVGLALGPVISGFGQAAESAGGMVDAVTGLPRRAGDAIHRIATEGVNLSHSLEDEALALSVTARQVGANMGYVGAELNRFVGRSTGMAMGLNIGADEAARAVRGATEAASELAAMGLESARDVARFSAGFGVNADLLRNAGLGMRRELGMADEQIGQLTSSIVDMGQETGDVAGALNELPQVMALLRRRRALGDTPEQLQQFASDTAAAARGMFMFGEDSDLARSTSAALAQQLTESRETFRNMFSGVGAELPGLVTEISIVSGSVDQAFEAMTQGPGQFMEAMGGIVQQVRDAEGDVGGTLEFMRARLQETFGVDQTASMINFWRGMDDETRTAMQAVRGAREDLGALGEMTHRTGRSMSEVMDRMRGAFQVRMRRGGRGSVGQLLQNTRESLDAVGDTMQRMARSEGPLRGVMGVLSDTQVLGALALLPAGMRGSAIAADELQQQLRPLVDAFTSWGGVLDTALVGVSLFATEVMAELDTIAEEVGEEDFNLFESLGPAIDRVADRWATELGDLLKNIEGWVVAVANTFAELDFSTLFATTGEGEEATGVMGAIRRIADQIGNIDWDTIWNGFRDGFNHLFEALRPWLEEKMTQIRDVIYNRVNDWWNSIDWGEVFSTVRGMGAALWGVFRPALVELGSLIGDWFSEHWEEVLGGSVLALGVVGLILGAALIVGFLAAFVLLPIALGVIIGGVIILIIEYFISLGPAIAEIWQFVVNSVKDKWDDFTEWFRTSLVTVRSFFTTAWGRMIGWLRTQWDNFRSWLDRMWDRVTGRVNQVIEDWQTIFSAIAGIATTLGQRIRTAIGDAIAWISGRWEVFREGLSGIWERLSSGWDTFLEGAEEVWENIVGIPARIETAWGNIIAFFRGIFAGIREAVGDDLESAGQFFERLAEAGSRLLRSIGLTGDEVFGNSIHTVIGEDMAQAEAIMTEAALRISEVMQTVLHDATVRAIVTGFAEGFAAVVENMDEFSADMVGAFTTMADSISEIMTELFVSVIAQAEISMLAAETAVEGIIGRLRTITEAQTALASARSEAVAGLARPQDEEAMRRRLAQLGSNEVLRAIHYPDWYRGGAGISGGGYRALFVAHMTELKRAIDALGVAPASGSVEARRQAIREASAAVTRARVGGHAGVPGGAGR